MRRRRRWSASSAAGSGAPRRAPEGPRRARPRRTPAIGRHSPRKPSTCTPTTSAPRWTAAGIASRSGKRTHVSRPSGTSGGALADDQQRRRVEARDQQRPRLIGGELGATAAAVVVSRGRAASSSDVLRSTSTPTCRRQRRPAARRVRSSPVSAAGRVGDEAAVGQHRLVAGDQRAVGGEPRVDLDPRQTGGDRRLERRERVLAGPRPAPRWPHRTGGSAKTVTRPGSLAAPCSATPRPPNPADAGAERRRRRPPRAGPRRAVRAVGARRARSDVELVAVDDASPDHAGEMLDELAASEPRLRVAAPRRAGRAPGRARGGDRRLRVVRRRRRRARAGRGRGGRWSGCDETPDVLIVGYERESALGARTPGAEAHHRRARPAAHGHDARRADLFDKVIRRDLGVTEPWPALLTRKRIAVDPETPLHPPQRAEHRGRRRREEAPDFFAPYDAAGLENELVREELLRQGLRGARTARATARRSSPSSPGAVGRRARAGRGSLRAYDALRKAREQRQALGPSQARKLAAAARKRELASAATRPRASSRSTRTSPSSPRTGTAASRTTRARSTRRRASSSRTCAASGSSDGGDARGVEHVRPGTAEYFDLLARAKYFVNNVNFPNHLVKRPGRCT